MKGLLLKDLYMMKTYCKSYLLIALLFVALSCLNNGNLLFIVYPCLLCGMIPVTLLGYDERSRWLQYSGTLPYTGVHIVSAKYLIGLFVQMIVLIITGIVQALRMNMSGAFYFDAYIESMMMLIAVFTVTSSITLPFVFKCGVEKGRIAYYVMIGILCAGSVIVSELFKADWLTDINLYGIPAVICMLGIVLYAFSWYLSVRFYNRREI